MDSVRGWNEVTPCVWNTAMAVWTWILEDGTDPYLGVNGKQMSIRLPTMSKTEQQSIFERIHTACIGVQMTGAALDAPGTEYGSRTRLECPLLSH